jgi:NAD(P)-dependent dehydrogenase (short-subunit alcohol dehydrogenase family)
VTSEDAVAALFSRHGGIRYLQHTAGISPRPLTPPEALTKEDVLGACAVNLWGAHNVLKQGIRTGAFAARTHGVIILSTSATVGSEGRASAAYEESKGGLSSKHTASSSTDLRPRRSAVRWPRRTRSARDACRRWRTACRSAA